MRMPTRFLSDAQRARYGRFDGVPSRVQIARYFHLDATDQEIIDQLRGSHNRLGFALQLGIARFLGVLPTRFDDIPSVVVEAVAAQLELTTVPSLTAYAFGRPKKRHAALIRKAYGFRELADDASARFRLTRWLYTLCWSGDDRPSLLIDRATAWMLAHKILLPGISTLERLVARIRDRAHRQLWVRLSDALSDAQRQKIIALLDGEGGSLRRLDSLRAAPARRAMTELLRHFHRIDDIRAYELAPPSPETVPNALIQRLAKMARTMRPSAIAVAKEPRRTAIIAALFHTLEAVAIDDAVELFDALLADTFRVAKAARKRKRLRSLGDLDAAALTLRDLARRVMTDDDDDMDLTFRAWRDAIYDELNYAALVEATDRVDTLAKPPEDKPLEELIAKWRTTHTLFRNLLARIEFEASPKGQPVKAAVDFLRGIENWAKADMDDAPTEILRGAWRKYALDTNGKVSDNKAYVFAVCEAWQGALKTRDIFVPAGMRFDDPRRGLLSGEAWQAVKPTTCRTLERSPNGETELATLADQLDQAYRRTAETFEANPAARTEIKEGKPQLVITPLDRIEEPDSLRKLRGAMRTRLPKVDLSDVLLEVANRTGFVQDFTHVTERRARVDGFQTSLCAVLLAEACNIGFEPIAQASFPPLRRDRLSWISQNFIRSETITAANARIVAAHNELPIVQHWGTGDVASADGIRFSAPPTVIHAGPNPKYFKTGRGITLYNLVSDQFTGLNALVVPGTLRDSMFILALLLDQETDLEPVEIMTDAAAYSDIVFGLFWLLGYQFSPRLADIGQTRLWRIDRQADYGPLDPLARNKINVRIIIENWEDLLRLAGSLKFGHIHAGAVMRTLQVRERTTALAKALGELGKIIKSLHILRFVNDEETRRRILIQLNRQELRHSLARRVCYGERGEIRKPYRQGQEEQLGALGFTLNAIAFWNATYMQLVLDQLETEGWNVSPDDVARISPLTNRHINFLGRHAFDLPENIATGELRPLRNPNSER